MKRAPTVDVDMGLGRQYGYRSTIIDRPVARLPAPCHPNRPIHARGKCETCYKRDWRKEHR